MGHSLQLVSSPSCFGVFLCPIFSVLIQFAAWLGVIPTPPFHARPFPHALMPIHPPFVLRAPTWSALSSSQHSLREIAEHHRHSSIPTRLRACFLRLRTFQGWMCATEIISSFSPVPARWSTTLTIERGSISPGCLPAAKP